MKEIHLSYISSATWERVRRARESGARKQEMRKSSSLHKSTGARRGSMLEEAGQKQHIGSGKGGVWPVRKDASETWRDPIQAFSLPYV